MQRSQMIEDKVISAIKEFAGSINAASKVVADMSALVEATSQLPLSNFDYWERLIRSEFSQALKHLTQSQRESKPAKLLTWLDLISWDGYKREKTLKALSGAAPNVFFFSLAIRRLNDWVPQVRAAAREKLPEIANNTAPEHVVEALCIALSNWNSWKRIEKADKQVLLQLICKDEIVDALKMKLISSASGPMPALFSQVGRSPVLDDDLETIATLAAQPSVRAKAYRSLFEGRITWTEGHTWVWTDIRYCEGRLKAVVSERKLTIQTPFFDLLRRSSVDRSSIVRRVSAEFLIRELDQLRESAREFAEKFASDKSNPVAERGLFALKKLAEMERINSF
ncbi:MAG: hypothetical protein KJ556_17620 [Gammaproteobacteria bacterium]|nr:hypothetical protein [Gammaproteobacteria bacterium]MBU2176926.1 hypothetical protein [Gammaproteobacteria bacterium]MBU2246033.1 hypothetical protein [Gammaproteobacteria bacterium]MBU2344104.1 hypothetical protein [Gammaproteobacteria bacterium]MBU2392796.1 hypothetical protein [Gammaproteobacteria bacterium]